MSRKLTEKVKKEVASDQNYKCANKPASDLLGIGKYKCPLWEFKDGSFDGAGYEIDHIIDHAKTHDDNPDNLQALCPCCHRRKTRNSGGRKKKKVFVESSSDEKSDIDEKDFSIDYRKILLENALDTAYLEDSLMKKVIQAGEKSIKTTKELISAKEQIRVLYNLAIELQEENTKLREKSYDKREIKGKSLAIIRYLENQINNPKPKTKSTKKVDMNVIKKFLDWSSYSDSE